MPDSGIYYANKGLQLSLRLHDKRGEATMLNHLGIIDENQGRFSLARQKFLRAISAYKQIGDKSGVADETVRLGVTEMRQGNFDKATAFFFKALKVHEAGKNQRGIMECNITLGEAYMGQLNYDVALTYLKTAERISQKLPLMGLTLYIYNNLGLVYSETGELQRAISYYEKGIKLSNEPQYAGLNVTLLNGLGMAYAKAGNHAKAISLQLTALDKARKIKNYLRELQTLNGLADTYSKQEPAKALTYLHQAIILARQKNANKVAIETLKRIATIYENLGNYKLALKTTKQERALSDSIFNLAKSTEIAGLQASYDLQRSKASIEKLKYLNRDQKSQQKIIISVAIAVISILVIVLVFYARIKKYNQQLKSLNADLSASNQSKDKLFSILGHDLRAPLATVKNFLSLLDDNELTLAERNHIIDELRHNCDASLDVLNKLLKWGQVQIKGELVNPVHFSPVHVIEQNVQLFKNAAAEKNIIINVKVDAGVNILFDRDHFDFIIRNLLSNAIKFTGVGGYVMIGSIENGDQVNFYIKDSGVGMSAEQIAQIFRRINVSKKGTLGEKGTGLGLMLAYEFVQANGGHIKVESEQGKGTTFTLTLSKAN